MCVCLIWKTILKNSFSLYYNSIDKCIFISFKTCTLTFDIFCLLSLFLGIALQWALLVYKLISRNCLNPAFASHNCFNCKHIMQNNEINRSVQTKSFQNLYDITYCKAIPLTTFLGCYTWLKKGASKKNGTNITFVC